MSLWAYFFAACFLFTAVAFTDSTRAVNQHVIKTASTVGASMRTYRVAAVEYAEKNPTIVGAVADANLPLPGWFQNTQKLQNYQIDGKAYVYYVPQAPRVDLAAMGFRDGDGLSELIGVAHAGF